MKHDHISFIDYNMDQLILPLDLEIKIPQNHLSRLVHEAVEQIDDEILYRVYPGGGRAAYHPKMMLKVIIYAYAKGIFSSRKIASLLQENIYFMWLANYQQPDFRTINRFRSERMKDIIYETFFSIVDLLHQQGLIKLEEYFLDGTKIEANANKYTFVWRKATEKFDAKLDEKYRKIVAGIEAIAEEDEKSGVELSLQERLDQKPVTSDQIKDTIEALEKRLETDRKNKEIKKAKRQLEKDLLPRKQKYEAQKGLFKGRNSYSKTDKEATFMRMKEDHMKNGQLKPGYNVQIGTENQFIVGFSLHQRAGDPGCLKPHFGILESYDRPKPKTLIADSGYGSEENYAFCEKEKIEAYVKYNTLDKEQTKAWKNQVGRVENMTYDEELDEWICANNERLTFAYEKKDKTDNGYTTRKRSYRCVDCQGCPFQLACAKGKDTKTITVSLKNQKQRKEVRERLSTKDGDKLYRRRKCDVEPVFGQIKYNRGFNRFLLRGLSKTTVEWGLVSIAHNLIKWANRLQPKVENAENNTKKAA